MNKLYPISLLIVSSFASTGYTQAPLVEQALQQSGATESALPAAKPIDTVAAPVPSALPAKDTATLAPPSMVKVGASPMLGTGASTPRFRILFGATDWHWEESGDDGKILLVEGGWMPGFRAEYAWLRGGKEFGVSFDMGFGAIEYDGAIQNTETEEIIPYKSNTHYSEGTLEGFFFLPLVKGPLVLDFGGRVGYHKWVRTIGSKQYDHPGEHGYVETWSHLSMQPVIALQVPFGRASGLRLEGGYRFGFSSNEEITEYKLSGINSMGDTVEVSLKPKLKPNPKPALRANVLLKIQHLLLEVEYLGLDYGKSKPWVNSKLRYAMLQPGSYLDRLDARVGWEF